MNRHLLRYFSLFLLTLWLAACDTKNEVTELPFEQLNDVSYGNNPQQKFDLYLPKGRTTNTPLLIFIHGGSWSGGDKVQYAFMMPYFSDRSIAVLNLNYRLVTTTTNKHPAQIDDIKAVIDFIRQKTNEYQISADKIVISGHSAGAHLSLLYAYQHNSDKRIKAVVGLASPTDFVEAGESNLPEYNQTIEFFLGKTFKADATLWRNASPYWAVATGAVPTLIFHGEKDTTVPSGQSKKMKAKLDQLGIKSQLVLYPNEEHIWINDNLGDTLAKMVDWVKGNV